jgi:hypothetical protein
MWDLKNIKWSSEKYKHRSGKTRQQLSRKL